MVSDSILLIFVIFIGLSFGSFATAVAWRVPRGEQFVHGRSRCPACRHPLGALDLFPAFSWLWLRGKCRHCGVEYGASYLWAELATSVLVTIVYLRLGITPEAGVLMMFSVAIVILSLIDLRHSIIPDGLNLALLIIAALYQLVMDAPVERFLIGPLAGVGTALALRQLMFVWKKQEGLGLGDVKLAAAIGMFLPLEAITAFLFLSGVIGIITALLWKMLGKGERFPFGPALSVALYICLVVPEVNLWWQQAASAWLAR